MHLDWEMLAAAFTAGVAWSHVGYQLGQLRREVKVLRENHIEHLEQRLAALPCAGDDDWPKSPHPER